MDKKWLISYIFSFSSYINIFSQRQFYYGFVFWFAFHLVPKTCLSFFSTCVFCNPSGFSPSFPESQTLTRNFLLFLLHLPLDCPIAILLLFPLMSLGGSLLSSIPHHAIFLNAWFSGSVLSVGWWRSTFWILTPGLCPIVGVCLLLTHRKTQQKEVEIHWGRECSGFCIPSLSRPSFKFISFL